MFPKKNEKYAEAQRLKKSKVVSKFQAGFRYKRKQNKFEKRCDVLFKSIDARVRYVGDGQLWIGGRNPDFIVDGTGYLIEVFGTYWHPKKDEEFRKSHFGKFGYETLVLWDSDFLDPMLVREKVKAFIKKK